MLSGECRAVLGQVVRSGHGWRSGRFRGFDELHRHTATERLFILRSRNSHRHD